MIWMYSKLCAFTIEKSVTRSLCLVVKYHLPFYCSMVYISRHMCLFSFARPLSLSVFLPSLLSSSVFVRRKIVKLDPCIHWTTDHYKTIIVWPTRSRLFNSSTINMEPTVDGDDNEDKAYVVCWPFAPLSRWFHLVLRDLEKRSTISRNRWIKGLLDGFLHMLELWPCANRNSPSPRILTCKSICAQSVVSERRMSGKSRYSISLFSLEQERISLDVV